ncbi:UbiA family prenyltransferase [Nonomuraea sp. NPDC050663]|uniref:UbiA family prenyltransferase n=1 Tax=Nonomuraea sp. NPDC050663 TaxID=3364370 RepID=UPI0037947832
MISAKTLRGLVGSCHPGPTAAVTLLVAAIIVASGRDVAGCVVATAAVLTGQLSIGWCNDAVDAERDAAAGRTAKPIVAGLVSVRLVRASAFTALALCVPLSLASGLAAGLVHLAGVGAAWAYDLWLKATMLSWLPYVIGFGSLPAFVTLGLPGAPWPAWWAVSAAALLGLGAHLANVLPDLEADLAGGIRGWPQRLGRTGIAVLLPLPLVAATALLAFGPYGTASALSWGALVLACIVTAAGLTMMRRAPKALFAAAVAVAGIDVILLITNGARLTG